MEAPDGSPPQSLCMIRAAELFPKPIMEKEDNLLAVPYKELDGESVRYLGRSDDGILALSNYRLFLLKNSNNSETSVPLGLIETAQTRDLFHLLIFCKDASTVKCSFETAEQCSEWQRRIQLSIGIPESLESLFAFPFCSWTCEARSNSNVQSLQNGQINENSSENLQFANALFSMANTMQQESLDRLQRASLNDDDFMKEVERLGFDLNGPWRISTANQDFKLCPSYPQKLLVPCCIADDTLQIVANYRASRRLPAVVWRHKKSGAVIARCSQPEVGWLGWRNYKDEQLLKALADACAFDRGEQTRKLVTQNGTGNGENTTIPQNIPSGENSPTSLDGSHEEVALDEVRKVLIVDARSYTSAVTNRARGGGCECIEYYPCAEIEFMNLGNIHVIRKSFNALKALCASPGDVPNWLGTLERSNWLQHLSGLLAASMTVCHAIEKKGRPVLVHCSDGWDRTPQIVATAELCLDPYYRTVEGFRILVEREWLNYGHKFADRCGHGPNSDDPNERCPVFLQWLDLVHQIHKQFPCAFEFSMAYLIKLAQHSLSCLFGTFLCNTLKERIDNSVFERTFSVWPFLSDPMYLNPLYVPLREKVLWPAHNVRDLSLWTEVYLGSLGNQNSSDCPNSNIDGTCSSGNPMIKTRSYGDLVTGNTLSNGLSRRSSDPNMTVDPNLTVATNSESNSVADMQSEREDSPDLIANTAYDTSRKLQDLTTELNNEDDEKFKNFLQSTTILTSKVAEVVSTKTCPPLINSIENELLKDSSLDENQDNENTLTVSAADIERKTLTKTNSETLFSSLQKAKQFENMEHEENKQNDNESSEQIGCHYHETSHSSSINSSEFSTNLSTSIQQKQSSHQQLPDKEEKSINLNETINCLQNGFNGLFKCEEETTLSEDINSVKNIDVGKVNLDLMQSVDLSETNGVDSEKWPHSSSNEFDNIITSEQTLWHNSVNTSTDTLVPIDHKHTMQNTNSSPIEKTVDSSKGLDEMDGNGAAASMTFTNSSSMQTSLNRKFTQAAENTNTLLSTNSDHLPKVHNIRPNSLMNEVTIPSTVEANSDDNNIYKTIRPAPEPPMISSSNINKNPMEESIMILPLHQKLEISLNGKCETVNNNNFNNSVNSTNTFTTIQNATAMQPSSNSTTTASPYMNGFNFSAQRRQRTFSTNSRRDGMTGPKIQSNGSTSRFSIPGIRSLPLTPPGVNERQQLALSCPDGLTHALSEQNIRLQQIVYEHKLREEVLRREVHDMRIALLKKICPSCNNAAVPNDEQSSMMDNIENASICSWEAVDDRSGPSSCTSSSTLPNTTSVLWVPDHAVSRCTSCQTEFWLGRRKHHCRSCGQIFCADCSEFWAPLPLEKLFTPVRLCGPCYHAETTRMQMSQFQNNALLQHHLQQQNTPTKTNNSAVLSTQTTPAAATSKA